MLFKERLDFEIITPLYMGGIHSRAPGGRDRIRPRAILGMLGYWFRAKMAGLCGDDPALIRELEASLFGGAEPNQQDMRCSEFRLSIVKRPDPNKLQEYVGANAREQLLNYVAYGMAEKKPKRKGLMGDFSLQLVCDHDKTDMFFATLWLATTFGGFGARQRRGLGAIEWKNQIWSGEQSPVRNTVDGIQKGLERVDQIYKSYYQDIKNALPIPSFVQAIPSFDVLHQHYARIRYCNNANSTNPGPFPDAKAAIEAIRDQLRLRPAKVPEGQPNPLRDEPAEPEFHLGDGYAWRQRQSAGWEQGDKPGGYNHYYYYQGKDHDEAARAFDRNDEDPITIENIALGLPIPFRFDFGDFVVNAIDPNGEVIRRPSPISFKVIRETNGAFHVLCCWFKSAFLPDKSEIRARKGEAPNFTIDREVAFNPLIDPWPIVEAFFNGLKGEEIYRSAATHAAQQL